MYNIRFRSSVQQEKIAGKPELSPIQKGHKFIDYLVINFPNELESILTDSSGKDMSMISTDKLRSSVYDAIKNQDPIFIDKLALLVHEKENSKGFDDASRTIRPLETKFSDTGTTERFFDEIYTKKDAIAWLVEQGWFEPAAEDLVQTKGAKAKELDGFFALKKTDKKKFDWNLALDTTGKVAQSIFYLGSIFKKNDTPVPSVSETDITVNQTKNNTVRNIIIGGVIVVVLIVAGIFLFRKKGPASTAAPATPAQ